MTARPLHNVARSAASDESAFLTGVDIPVDGGLRFTYPVWRPGEVAAPTSRRTHAASIGPAYGEEATRLL